MLLKTSKWLFEQVQNTIADHRKSPIQYAGRQREITSQMQNHIDADKTCLVSAERVLLEIREPFSTLVNLRDQLVWCA